MLYWNNCTTSTVVSNQPISLLFWDNDPIHSKPVVKLYITFYDKNAFINVCTKNNYK